MAGIRWIFGCAAMAACLTAVPASASTAMENQLDRCFDQQQKKLPFSGIVAASDGQARFERAAGFVDAAGKQPATGSVPFRLASVQKVLTQVAIGQLVDQGKVALEAPVGKYVSGLPAGLAQVTIEQLLHHTSGAASFTMMHDRIIPTLKTARTARELVPLVASQPLAFPPGSRTEYSNGGYFLLGAVIEAVSGKTYGDYLQSQIFGPLGMAASGLASVPGTASPHSLMSPEGPLDKPRAVPIDLLLPATPAGDGVSSAADLLRLGRALVGDQLISNATKERIFPRRSGPWRIGQSGGTIGTNTDFSAFPESGWVVVVLSNEDPPAGELMGEVLRKVVNGAPCQPLGAGDRPSPFMIIKKPPPQRGES